MNQKGQDKDMPNRQSNMEPAEGSRDSALSDKESFERGMGGGSERMRGMSDMDRDKKRGERNRGDATGITNRGLEMEQEEQRHVPERGSSRSDS